MQRIRRRWRRDILVLSPEEMDQVDWSTVHCGCIYLDIRGQMHLELHHRGFNHFFHNTNWWHLLVDQTALYRTMPERMLRACRAKPAHELIGARQFIYIRKARLLCPSNVGILPWERLRARGDLEHHPELGEIRRHAYRALFVLLDEVARRLGAIAGFFPTATIPDDKMLAYGCFPFALKGWRQKFFKLSLTFPFRGQRIYSKVYQVPSA